MSPSCAEPDLSPHDASGLGEQQPAVDSRPGAIDRVQQKLVDAGRRSECSVVRIDLLKGMLYGAIQNRALPRASVACSGCGRTAGSVQAMTLLLLLTSWFRLMMGSDAEWRGGTTGGIDTVLLWLLTKVFASWSRLLLDWWKARRR